MNSSKHDHNINCKYDSDPQQDDNTTDTTYKEVDGKENKNDRNNRKNNEENHPPMDDEFDSSNISSSASFLFDFTSPSKTNYSPTEAILRHMVDCHTPPPPPPPPTSNSWYTMMKTSAAFIGGKSHVSRCYDVGSTIKQKRISKNDTKIVNSLQDLHPKRRHGLVKMSVHGKKDKRISNQRILKGNKKCTTKQKQKFNKKEQNDVVIKCGCKNSNCIKLYCNCFQAGAFCSTDCNCNMCYNMIEENKKRNSYGGKKRRAKMK